jgi:transglutaminase-like putative cysteine protease
VCRDFAHLALTFCRCMGIPARYCTGYMGDIGIPPDPAPMDFSGWFEAYLSGQWYTFDARHNHPRIGRILMGTGRDAADVAAARKLAISVAAESVGDKAVSGCYLVRMEPTAAVLELRLKAPDAASRDTLRSTLIETLAQRFAQAQFGAGAAEPASFS